MDEVCVFCDKTATKLCDFPMGYQTFAGHTPKALVISDACGTDTRKMPRCVESYNATKLCVMPE